MPTSNWFVRADSGTANNASLNVKPDPSFQITFASDGDGDGIPDFLDDSDSDGVVDENDPDSTTGDLVLQQPSSDATNLLADANTLVSVDGGATWEKFVYIQSGDIPNNKSPAGEELFLIRTLSSNLRLVGLSTDPTRAGADRISNGGINVTNRNTDDQPVCFSAGTMIQTPLGPRAVESLKAGDLVSTKDHGPQPLLWVGNRRMYAAGQYAPIRIAAGTFGTHEDLVVSPQHRILISHWRAELMFGEHDVLVAAKHLVDGNTVRHLDAGVITYVHIMFAKHEIVNSNGLYTESFFVGDRALSVLDAAARQEILEIFKELGNLGDDIPHLAARPIMRAWEGRVARGFF